MSEMLHTARTAGSRSPDPLLDLLPVEGRYLGRGTAAAAAVKDADRSQERVIRHLYFTVPDPLLKQADGIDRMLPHGQIDRSQGDVRQFGQEGSAAAGDGDVFGTAYSGPVKVRLQPRGQSIMLAEDGRHVFFPDQLQDPVEGILVPDR